MISGLKPNYKMLLVLIVCLLAPTLSYQQTKSGDDDLLRNFQKQIEDVYKYDDLLVNGHLYRPSNIKVKGSPYFIKDKLWKKGSIYIKGRKFLNQDVAYNIMTNELVTSIIFPDGSTKNIILDKSFIDSLYIKNHFFINVSPYTENRMNEIYEQVYGGNFKALLSHHVNFIPEVTSNTPNGYYTKIETSLYLLEDGKFVRIPNRKSLLKFFFLHKKEIARYIRLHRIKLKSAQNHELFTLFKYCDDISN